MKPGMALAPGLNPSSHPGPGPGVAPGLNPSSPPGTALPRNVVVKSGMALAHPMISCSARSVVKAMATSVGAPSGLAGPAEWGPVCRPPIPIPMPTPAPRGRRNDSGSSMLALTLQGRRGFRVQGSGRGGRGGLTLQGRWGLGFRQEGAGFRDRVRGPRVQGRGGWGSGPGVQGLGFES